MGKDSCKEKDTFIAIPASVGGISFVIVLMFLIFAGHALNYAVSIIWALVILGMVSAFFAYLSKKQKK
ncbi:MAG: hypothetical protein ABIC95_03225 [archaeon]